MDANIAVGHLGNKGRIVLPKTLRGNWKQGEPLLITKQGEQIVLRKASAMEHALQAKVASGGSPKKVSPHVVKKAAPKKGPAKFANTVHKKLKRDKFGHFLPAKKK